MSAMVTDPPAPDAVIAALEHVRSIFPEVVMVVFQRDTRWQYMGQDFDHPVFDDRVNTGILEDASAAVEEFPAVFEVVPEEEQVTKKGN